MSSSFCGLDVTKKIRHKNWPKYQYIQLTKVNHYDGYSNYTMTYGNSILYADKLIQEQFYESELEGWEYYYAQSEFEKAGLKDIEYGDSNETKFNKLRDALIYLLEKKNEH